MAKVHPDLAEIVTGDPSAMVEAILTAEGSLQDLLAALPEDILVVQGYRLTGSVAIECRAGALRELAELPSVAAIEPVRSVGAW